jgi:hypothetical protein
MQPPYWRYFIIDDQGRSYAEQNGIVTATSLPTPLPHSPNGWQEISLLWERDMKRFGLNRKSGLPYGYLLEGAKILRKTVYTENVERKLYLIIQELTLVLPAPGEFFWRYKYFSKLEFDFPKAKDSELKIEVPLIEGGAQRLFDANKDTDYEIPFDAHSIIIKLDGIFLYKTFNFLIPGINDSNEGGLTHTTNGNFHHLVGINFTTSDGEAAGFAVESVFYTDLPNTPTNSAQINLDFGNSLNYFFAATQDISGVQIQGTISVRSTTPTDADYALFLYKNDGTGVTLCAGGINNAGFTTFTIDRTIDVRAGDKYFLIGSLGGYVESIQYGETRLKINIHSRYKATYCKAFKGIDLFKKLAKKMGIDPALCSSALLASVQNIVITSGNAIRSLEGSSIKTSMSAFLDFCYSEHAGCFGIENGKLLVETYRHFLNTDVIKPLGNAKNWECSYAEELFAKSIKVGYPAQNIDSVNGKFSFNNTYVFSTPNTHTSNELNLVCPYLGDPYLIETRRLNLDGKTTTDNSNDNDTFLLNVDLSNPVSFHADGLITAPGNVMKFSNAFDFFDAVDHGDTFTLEGTVANNRTFTIVNIGVLSDGRIAVATLEPVTPEVVTTQVTFLLPVFTLKRLTYDSITGVPVTSELFNVDYLTPKEMLLRHLVYINSIMDGFAGQDLIFQTTDKNKDLKTVWGGLVIEQKANVTIGTEKLFIPKYFDFENEVPVDLVEAMDVNPNTAFSVVWNDVTYTVLSKNMGIAPNTMKEQSFKMLLAPGNNLSNLL